MLSYRRENVFSLEETVADISRIPNKEKINL